MNRSSNHAWEILACGLALALGIFVIGQFQARQPSAQDRALSQTRSDLRVLMAALNAYRDEARHFPGTAQGLQELRQKHYLPDLPLDPWGRPYVYRHPGRYREYDLLSRGPDGVESADDLTLWSQYQDK